MYTAIIMVLFTTHNLFESEQSLFSMFINKNIFTQSCIKAYSKSFVVS